MALYLSPAEKIVSMFEFSHVPPLNYKSSKASLLELKLVLLLPDSDDRITHRKSIGTEKANFSMNVSAL